MLSSRRPSMFVRGGRPASLLNRRRGVVYRSADGKRVVGTARVFGGRRCLFKRVRPNHQLTSPPAWAWDTEVLRQAKGEGIDFGVLQEEPSGRFWAAPLAWFEPPLGFAFVRGHGAQRGLPVGMWSVGRTAAEALERASVIEATSQVVRRSPDTAAHHVRPEQVGLFEETRR